MGKKTTTKRTVGFSSKQVKAANAARDKGTHRTPKVILDAFLPERVKAGNIPLNKINMSVIMCLEKIESPFLSDAVQAKYRHVAEALYVLTQPIAQVRESLEAGTFNAGVNALADELDMNVLLQAVPAIRAHIDKAFATAIPYGDGKSGPLEGHPSQTEGSGGS